jgi:hypothetical protein
VTILPNCGCNFVKSKKGGVHGGHHHLTTQKAGGNGGCRRILSFLLANHLLGISISEIVYEYAKRDPQVGNIIRRVFPLFSQAKRFDAEGPCYFHLMMDVRERRLDRARFLWRLASTDHEHWRMVRDPVARAAFPTLSDGSLREAPPPAVLRSPGS